MALLPIKIAPGFFKNGTQYQAKNRWYSGNLVRFSEGRLRPIGGWQRLAETQITKKGGIETLTITTAGTGYVGNGTLGFSGGAGSSFTGTYTSLDGAIATVAIATNGTGFTSAPTITLTPASGSAGSGAVITPTFFAGVDPIRGLHSWRLSTGVRYLAVGSVQSLRLWDGSQSSGVNAPIYDITPSSSPGSAIPFASQDDFQISGLGYGALEYGGDTGITNFDDSTGSTPGGDIYGTPRYPPGDPSNVSIDPDSFRDNFASVVSFDNFGDDLLACHTGEGTIWYLDVSGVSFNNATQTATAPVALQTLSGSTGVPTSANVAVLVTPERHIMVLGPGGAQRKIQWGSQESLIDFTPSLVNTAGDLELQTKGRIIGGFKTRYGVLIFTTSDVWRTNYLGPPYVYGTERLTEGGGPVGMKSIAGSADFVAWMSRGRFWSYTGGYIKELECSVADYIFADINLDVEGLIAAGHNGEFGEITWFFPKEGDSVCTRYVTYSYREQHWVTGELERVALEPSDALGYPVWAGSDGFLYRHEMDPDTQSTPIPRDTTVVAPADVTTLSAKANRVVAKGVSTNTHPNVATENHLCYAETGAIEIAGGNKMMSVKQILTDTDAGTNGLRLEVVTGKTPDAPGETHGPFTLEGDGYTDCRFTDRQTFLKVSSPFDQEWRFGELRFDAAASGER